MKRRLVERLWVRFHMSLILMACGLSAMLASWTLLQAGVGSMLARYPLVVVTAYAVFLLCVWLWVKYADRDLAPAPPSGEEPPASRAARKKNRSGDWSLDLPSGGGGGSGGSSGGGGAFSGKGGGFDGGGASASWAESGPRVPLTGQNVQSNAFLSSSKGDWTAPAPDADAGSGGSSSGGGKGGGFDIGLDLDFEGLVLVVLAVALVAAIAIASGYLVWAAPDILAEAAFGAALAGGLARRSREQDSLGWVAGVMKKTWWPFAVVLVLAIAFAGWARAYYPQAQTFQQAIDAALAGDGAKDGVTK